MEEPRLVRLALEHRFITPEQVEQAESQQRELADRGLEHSVWFLLQDLGFISDAQIRELRKHMSSSGIRALEVEGYVLQGRIGSGGMGDVFRAENAAKQRVAVKLLASKFARNEEHGRRFQREARAGMRLLHPHITRSLSAGDADGQRYLIMELVEGTSLKQRLIDQGRMAEADLVVLLWQMASALAYAWGHGVLHRDVKPANLMLAPPRAGVAEPFCAKVCDFGLAKVLQGGADEPESHGQLTGTGMALGTPHYMAPEQASGEQDLDQRADIYSLGASAYHALLGQTMHSGKSSTIIMYKQVTESADLKPLREAGVTPGLVKLLGRMLDKDRKRRFTTWDEVLAGLAQVAPAITAAQQAALGAGLAAMPPRPAGSSRLQAITSGEVLPSAAEPVTGALESRRPGTPPAMPAAQPARPPAARSDPYPATPVGSARRGRLLLVGAVLLLVAGAGAGAAIALHAAPGAPTGPRSVAATPADFSAVLAQAAVERADHRALELVLAPGDYPGPWRFGVAHSGLTVRAGGHGVRVIGPGLGADTALVRLEPGLTGFRLAGIELAEAPGPALEALVSARAEIADCSTTAPIALSGAQLHFTNLRATGGMVVENQARLRLDDSLLSGPTALVLRDGHVELHQSWLCGTGGSAGTVVSAAAGGIELDAVVITARWPGEAGTGLALGPHVSATLHDVAIDHLATGIEVDRAELTAIDGLTITTSATALRWSGPRGDGWRWERLLLQAPEPLHGLSQLAITGEGARPERLVLVPK
jgi:serine/threonine-protein kinase